MKTNSILKRSLLFLMGISIGLFGLIGCSSNHNYETTSSGLLYRIINDKSGDSVSPGEFMKVSVRTVVNDSVMKEDSAQWVPLKPSMGRQYDVMEGLSHLTKGDSAEFKIPATHIFVKVLDVKDRQGYQAAMAKEKEGQKEKDAQIIRKYVDSTGEKAKISDDGVNVLVHKKGNGDNIKEGQVVSIMYTGKTLDGKVFDSNQDSSFHHTDPLEFPVGKGRMIPGMESGLKLLKKGAEATLVIPSALAYGERGRPPQIKPNSVLLFNVKILDVKDKK